MVAVAPRYAWCPPRARSLGPECAAFWRAAGGTLFDWQEAAIDAILGLGEDDLWASTNDGVNVARQNGKGVILQAIEAFVAFELGSSLGYSTVMHTAHEFATSLEHQLRLEDVIREAPHLHSKVKERGGYKHANGQESINLRDGTRIIFKARTRGGGRGFSGDLLVWDEAMEVPETVIGAQKPTLRASKARYGPKTIYAGSAVDQEVHLHGVAFARIRERGIANAAKVSYLEFSAPFDHPSDLTDEILRDRRFWPMANPSMPEGLIAEETMADEIETMPPRIVAVELYGVGDWPATDGSGAAVIKAETWAERVDLSDPPTPILDPVCFAFDITPDRSSASIGVAGKRGDGHSQVEVVENKSGTGWVVPRLIGLAAEHDGATFICDGYGPATSLLRELEEAGIVVEAITAADYANACGLIFDLVDQKGLRHRGTAELTAAVKGAGKRPLGERWAWARKGAVDISPLVACTLALWGSHTFAGDYGFDFGDEEDDA